MEKNSPTIEEIRDQILKENNLDHNSRLYRYTSERHLKKMEEGTERIQANNEAVEMVVDPYEEHGHVFVAKDIGPGLSFLTEPLEEYEREDRVCVSVKISDILDQGGRIYRVTSLPAYINAVFITLPGKEIAVERA
jgi:hypothetical protein